MTTHNPDRDGDEARSSSTATRRSLLDRARAREAAAWDRLVSLYAPLVLAWCRRAVKLVDAVDAAHLSGHSRCGVQHFVIAPGDRVP